MNETRFKNLIKNFSPELLTETFKKSHEFFRIKNDLIISIKDDKFTNVNQFGEFELEDNTKVLAISAKTLTPLSERSGRRNQYDIAKKILKDNPRFNAGIFVYYDNKGDFRMSLIYAEYLGTKVDYSAFRRFTYFVSNSLENVTFIKQVAPFNFTKLKELKDLFSVEKVTKEFFKKYHDLFLDTLEDFEKNEIFQNVVVKKGISKTSDFVKKMMGQIVFLYFVQKKGWLGVRPGENWGSGDQSFLRTLFTACKKSDKNYFNDYLEPLFYKALAEKRGDDDFFEELNCRIPFLNGGLFESVYNWEDTEIIIHNNVFEKLLNFFDQYNFTVDENTPSDQEISVDPEMLGKIFENLLEVKDRKDKGAFYTPREIVHYMCRESLIQHLVSENTAPEERIRKIFEIKDTDLSVLIDYKKTEAIKKMQNLKDIADKVDISLRNVKIVDPAVGSGAFPMGMLNEISSVRYYLNSNFLHKTNQAGKELTLYDIKKETLENCIYAVDLEPGAVEIAKLRFWLALIVEYESNDSNIAPPTLPNLDYKIMQGNSLLEEYEGVKLFDEKIIETVDTDKEKQTEDLKHRQSIIQKEYLALSQKNELTSIKKVELDTEAKKINDQLKKLNQVDKNEVEKIGLFDLNKHKESKLKADELKSLQKQFFETNKKDKKENIKKQIERLEWELIEATLKEEGKTLELGKIEELKKSNTKPFFLWKLHFTDVFEQKGGFDIVIANPPYVRQEEFVDIKNSLKSEYKDFYNGRADLYTYFFKLGLQLTKSSGILTYITSNKFFVRGYGKNTRYLLTENAQLEKILNFGELPVFQAAVDSAIIIAKNIKPNIDNVVCFAQAKHESDILNLDNFVKDKSSMIETKNLGDSEWSLQDSSKLAVLNKIKSNKNTLGEYYKQNIFGGIKTGYDEAFIIDEKTKKDLINRDKRCNEFIKPWLHGKDVRKWSMSYKNLYILYIPINKIEIDDYPVIKEHFLNFKTKLMARATNQKWWEIQQAQERFTSLFNRPKIIYPDCAKEMRACYDESGTYGTMAMYFIPFDSIIMGILNSKLFDWYSRMTFATFGDPWNGGRVIFKTIYMSKVPLPIFDKNISQIIKNKVDSILEIIKINNYHINTEKQIEVKNLENQIDELVYRLYDLSPEEIEIVENSRKN